MSNILQRVLDVLERPSMKFNSEFTISKSDKRQIETSIKQDLNKIAVRIAEQEAKIIMDKLVSKNKKKLGV